MTQTLNKAVRDDGKEDVLEAVSFKLGIIDFAANVTVSVAQCWNCQCMTNSLQEEHQSPVPEAVLHPVDDIKQYHKTISTCFY